MNNLMTEIRHAINEDTYIPKGIFSWFGYEFPLTERLRLVKKIGFDATSIWWGDEEELYRNGQGGIMPSMVRDHGLILDHVHVAFDHCNNLWSEDSSTREAIVDKHLYWIADCAENRVPIIVMHISHGSQINPPNEYGIESISKIVRAAEDADVVIAIENTRRIDYLEYVFERIQSPRLRLCYDSGHDWLYSVSPSKILNVFGELLACTHFADNDGIDDLHLLPGNGVVDWSAISAAFPRGTYSGCLSLEVIPSAKERSLSSEEFLSRAFECVCCLADSILACNPQQQDQKIS